MRLTVKVHGIKSLTTVDESDYSIPSGGELSSVESVSEVSGCAGLRPEFKTTVPIDHPLDKGTGVVQAIATPMRGDIPGARYHAAGRLDQSHRQNRKRTTE